ncbi:glycerol-3-phosphate dehydrogenase [Babesia caballi]|uniref:Glycerol-3-phosphate dehydrogenase [NAD(+)] n=1 Tax=Babesia caballi TaxID=5871 RepID=A0AAV4M250_BABCB|nr:glycerol-3-phosphate dehydrogenase [Babesia caballi]
MASAKKVCVIGCGNWGTASAKLVAENATRYPEFDDTVRIWVLEEEFEGRKLSEIINTDHENKKYLPGIKLPANLLAVPDMKECVQECDVFTIVLPHQFVNSTVRKMKELGPLKPGACFISLVKGIELTGRDVICFTDTIERELGVPCLALSGANVATNVALEEFSEATIGYNAKDKELALLFQKLFDRPYFKVNCVPGVAAVQVFGAIKNAVAIAAGFCDGLGLGSNTKAAIMRLGLREIYNFSRKFFNDDCQEVVFESAGVADLITTCIGGRNVRCAAEFAKHGGKKSWNDIEKEMLGGQKLQGTSTAEEVYHVLKAHNIENEFPLFAVTYKIAYEGAEPMELIRKFAVASMSEGVPAQLAQSNFAAESGSDGDKNSAAATSAGDEWERRHRRIQEAEHFRNLGNESFKRGFLESAIEYYSKAINCYPENFEYYTNRALCYKKQGKWQDVANDVRAALNLDADSVKAHYYLGQALLHLGEPEEGLKKLTKAKTLSEHYKVPYINEIEEEILRAKKFVWLNEDATFVQQLCSFKEYIGEAILRDKQSGTISEAEHTTRLSQFDTVFSALDRARERNVPSHLCCKISMCIMKDPVVSPSGITYERELLEQHLRLNGEFDPVTREACSLKSIYPNYSIKEAIDLFLKDSREPVCVGFLSSGRLLEVVKRTVVEGLLSSNATSTGAGRRSQSLDWSHEHAGRRYGGVTLRINAKSGSAGGKGEDESDIANSQGNDIECMGDTGCSTEDEVSGTCSAAVDQVNGPPAAPVFIDATDPENEWHETQLVDRCRIIAKGGRGGNGCVSFRREKHVPLGGADGGNGGPGGSVYVVCDDSMSNLNPVKKFYVYKAENGKHGLGGRCNGAKGSSRYIPVPPGTHVYSMEGDLHAVLKRRGDRLMIVRGGRGGKGNRYYKSKFNTAPHVCENGEEGGTREVVLNYKIVGNVALIGKPNSGTATLAASSLTRSGKSSMLRCLSNARPKVANYAFSTKFPVVGMLDVDKYAGKTYTDDMCDDNGGETRDGRGRVHGDVDALSDESGDVASNGDDFSRGEGGPCEGGKILKNDRLSKFRSVPSYTSIVHTIEVTKESRSLKEGDIRGDVVCGVDIMSEKDQYGKRTRGNGHDVCGVAGEVDPNLCQNRGAVSRQSNIVDTAKDQMVCLYGYRCAPQQLQSAETSNGADSTATSRPIKQGHRISSKESGILRGVRVNHVSSSFEDESNMEYDAATDESSELYGSCSDTDYDDGDTSDYDGALDYTTYDCDVTDGLSMADEAFDTAESIAGFCGLGGEEDEEGVKRQLVIADVPGLIEGASAGRGLGHKFLKHIENSNVLAYVIDASLENPLGDYRDVRNEVKLYNEELLSRMELVLLNKIDLVDFRRVEEIVEAFQHECNHDRIYTVSAKTRVNMDAVMRAFACIYEDHGIQQHLEGEPMDAAIDDPDDFRKLNPRKFKVEQVAEGEFRIRSKYLERKVPMMRFDLRETLDRLRRILRTNRIHYKLRRMGVKAGDTLHIGPMSFSVNELAY